MLSPGFTNSCSAFTALAEDLASHGYVVVGIDHTYESYGTAFPDGRVATCLARDARRGDSWQDMFLAGRPQALLDQPSPGYPEVTFCFPGGAG